MKRKPLPSMLHIASAIRHLRKKKDWTQPMLAEVAGYSTQTISYLENGLQSTDISTLENIAQALDTNAEDLIKLGKELKMADEPRLRDIVASNIHKHRVALGLSQEGLARKSNISLSHMRNIETASNSITIDKLESVATALNISPNALLK